MTATTTTDKHPLLDSIDLDFIKEGFDKVGELFNLHPAAEVQEQDITEQDLSEHEVEQLQDRADELNYAIEEVERIREELSDAYEELMNLIG